jgi:hypothetical protein
MEAIGFPGGARSVLERNSSSATPASSQAPRTRRICGRAPAFQRVSARPWAERAASELRATGETRPHVGTLAS